MLRREVADGTLIISGHLCDACSSAALFRCGRATIKAKVLKGGPGSVPGEQVRLEAEVNGLTITCI